MYLAHVDIAFVFECALLFPYGDRPLIRKDEVGPLRSEKETFQNDHKRSGAIRAAKDHFIQYRAGPRTTPPLQTGPARAEAEYVTFPRMFILGRERHRLRDWDGVFNPIV